MNKEDKIKSCGNIFRLKVISLYLLNLFIMSVSLVLCDFNLYSTTVHLIILSVSTLLQLLFTVYLFVKYKKEINNIE